MADLGKLLLRVLTGGLMFFSHGLGKLTGFSTMALGFPDPLHVGSHVSLSLTIFAEAICSLLVAFGLFTRLASIPPMMTMLVAALVIHAQDPWGKKEFALLYFIPFLAISLIGPGKYSLDEMRRKRR